MFGNKRKKATEFVVERMRPLIGIQQSHQGIPPRFWQDEFVLGFFYVMIAFHTEQSGYRLSEVDKGFLVSDVYTALSNINGVNIAERSAEMTMEVPQRQQFKLGADYAHICAFASIGKGTEEGRKLVEEAVAAVSANGEPKDLVGAIFRYLLKKLYFDEIAKRFRTK